MTTEETTFLAVLQEAFDQLKQKDALKIVREKAFDHFLELGLPENYAPLKLLYEQDCVPNHTPDKVEVGAHLYPECKNSFFVFVNGVFEPSLSNWKALPKQVVVLPLTDAARSYSTFLQNRWSKALKEERDPFAILNLALHPCGLFLYVPPKLVIETPIQCLFINTTMSALSFPRLHFFVAADSQIQCAMTKTGGGFTCEVMDVALEERAQLAQYKCSVSGFALSNLRATLKRESRLKSVSATVGAPLHRESYHATLAGENSEVNLQGLWKLEGKQQAHTHITIDHQAPHTKSMQKFKGVLSDFSRSSFEGKILVRPEAQKTEAYQLNNNLILGEYAISASKPNL